MEQGDSFSVPLSLRRLRGFLRLRPKEKGSLQGGTWKVVMEKLCLLKVVRKAETRFGIPLERSRGPHGWIREP